MKVERVYTVTDYWDGPRAGIADYDGRPHTFDAVFDDEADAWSDVFVLRPIDAETLALALEAWAIWLRWKATFDTGQTTTDTHPPLPADRARHAELEAAIERRLAARPDEAVRARALFRSDERSKETLVVWAALI